MGLSERLFLLGRTFAGCVWEGFCGLNLGWKIMRWLGIWLRFVNDLTPPQKIKKYSSLESNFFKIWFWITAIILASGYQHKFFKDDPPNYIELKGCSTGLPPAYTRSQKSLPTVAESWVCSRKFKKSLQIIHKFHVKYAFYWIKAELWKEAGKF